MWSDLWWLIVAKIGNHVVRSVRWWLTIANNQIHDNVVRVVVAHYCKQRTGNGVSVNTL